MGIKVFGKNILQVYSHHIMKIEYSKIKRGHPNKKLVLDKIKLNNISDEIASVGSTVTVTNLKQLVRKNGELCEGFILRDDEHSIGTVWVMYKGADDLEYRIRNIDAYIFGVFVSEQFRGYGYAGEMIRQLLNYLHLKGIETAYLAVSCINGNAIKAYKKAGFSIVRDNTFVRFLKINIPYHIL